MQNIKKMNISINPVFSDIFDENEPDIFDLLGNIPSNLIISILAHFNAELYLSDGIETQIKILESISRRFEKTTRDKILNKVKKQIIKNSNSEVNLFTIKTNLEFIHFELINFKEIDYEDSTPEQELNILKAYFIISKNIHENYYPEKIEGKIEEKIDENELFRKFLWPVIVDQIEINNPINPYVNLIKGLNFLNYFEQNENYKIFLETFLKKNNKTDKWNYILDLMNLLEKSWTNENSNIRPFLVDNKNILFTFFDSFILNQKDYKIRYEKDKLNYTGLKDKPIILNRNKLIILNWNFISNKLYEGLIFDFYKNSEINSLPAFLEFPNFKNYIAQEITEKKLFRKIIPKYLNLKKSILKFDNDKNQGFPDAYYRKGKYIYLFEIKDAYFPAKTISNYSHKEIKEAIDLKFNNKSKGTGQIIKQLKKLKLEPFEEKKYNELKLKTTNLVIYPIIIYTDFIFESPGFNKYLVEEFNHKIDNNNLKNTFQEIKNLTFINLSFFINHLNISNEINLKTLIDSYHKKIKLLDKKYKKNNNLDTLHKSNNNFEYFSTTTIEHKQIKSKNSKFKEISEILGLTNTLPNND